MSFYPKRQLSCFHWMQPPPVVVELPLSLCRQRLANERRTWRRDHPPGFFAKPQRLSDGSGEDLMVWDAGIPGPPNSDWAGGVYPLRLTFTEDYPVTPPKCQFPRGFFHVNIYLSGSVCLSIVDPDMSKTEWKPSITVPQILRGIQMLLVEPNIASPAHPEGFELLQNRPDEYRRRVQAQARQYALK